MKLVRYYEGVDGLKTGFTNAAGYCLTATANINGMRLITVVMGEPSSEIRSSETTAMLDYGYNMYQVEKIISKDTKIKKVKVFQGTSSTVTVYPKDDISVIYNKNDDKPKVTYEVKQKNISAPIKKDDIVGKIIVKQDNKIIKEIGLVTNKDIKKASLVTSYFRNIIDVIEGDISLG